MVYVVNNRNVLYSYENIPCGIFNHQLKSSLLFCFYLAIFLYRHKDLIHIPDHEIHKSTVNGGNASRHK